MVGRRTNWAFRRLGVVTGVAFAMILPVAPFASAQPDAGVPATTSQDGSRVVSIREVAPRQLRAVVHSTAMNRDVPLSIVRPADASRPAPTLYLLNGAGGGEDGASWAAKSDYVNFAADKHVNVVTPLAGRFSYYTDWVKDDPRLGKNKWTTFLTKELPPLIDAALGTNGVNSLAGISTSATSVFSLALAAPGLYKGLAAYSGCAQTSDPLGKRYIDITVNVWGGGNSANMWGPPGDPLWAANDPALHAEGLRGLALYISNGSGLPGPHDTMNDPLIKGQGGTLSNQILLGGVIEAATNICSHNLQNRLNELGIPAHFNFTPTGTHSWGYWSDALKDSWPVLAGAMGI